jgi:hypothetical protein
MHLQTIAATRNFRAARGLPADPVFDARLYAALGLPGQSPDREEGPQPAIA